MTDFAVNDAVHVVQRDGKKLEGVVAYVGPVDFAEGSDWVGVRLTGSSVGQGKNDGSVQGKSYFTAPANSGMFVRNAAVQRRTLTRLEELRLRRELNSTATGNSAASAFGSTTSTTTTTTTSPMRTTPSRTTAASSSSSSTPSTGMAKPQNKLEELRARRAALQEKKTAAAAERPSPPKTPATRRDVTSRTSNIPASAAKAPVVTASTTSTSDNEAAAAKEYKAQQAELQAEIQRLQAQVQQLSQDKEQQVSAVQAQLDKTRQELQQASERVATLEEEQTATAPTPPQQSDPGVLSEDLQEQFNQLQSAKDEALEQQQTLQSQLTQLQASYRQEQEAHAVHLNELTLARTQATTWQNEYQALRDQNSSKSATEVAQYKERARFQSELAAHQREKEQWLSEKQDLEAALEELTLDKDQLMEEKEALEDKVEELKLDAETAGMEVEELRMELEDAQQQNDAVASGDDSAEEKMQALSVQNARLREALIRLREQTTMEKMEATKQLRTAEKEVEEAQALKSEVETLRSLKASFEEQINDLKDMVEQGAAFEGMVEDLSDRVMSLEEDNIALQTTIREMEEAADLTAEMEEVQAEELKAMTRDLDGRDAIIHNLEEAIKMQRRREDDFRRTVGNYRTTVDLLKQEKQALLELSQSGEANKSSLIASSQKALARAAQLVSDAADMRKREAHFTFEGIDYQVYKHLSSRLEQILPPSLVAAEVAAMKGELVTSKVVGIASKSLEGIAQSFGKVIKPALPADNASKASSIMDLSDDAKQEVATMLHQTEYGHVLVDVSADLRRLLSAAQWPDLVTPEVSIELGSIVGHAVTDLESRISVVLKYLKEEGVLSPEQSSIDSLKQSIQVTMQRLRADTERDDAVLVPPEWQPLGWQLLKDVSTARFSCMGAAAALSSVLNQPEQEQGTALVQLYNRMEQASSQASNACLRMAHIDVQNGQLVGELSPLAASWKTESQELVNSIDQFLLKGGSIDPCDVAVSKVLKVLAKMLSSLRSAQLHPSENQDVFHPLAPESKDCWSGITGLVRTIRAVDGDAEDVNHIVRVRELERHIEQAIDNEPKLESAEAKVAQLEKTLSTRSKEIAMTNARLSELEKQLAKSSGMGRSRAHTADVKSAEEFNSLKEENRVLTEAMDVLQRQVDEYENEIRVLKDFKSPKRGAAARGTPRRALTSISDLASPAGRGAVPDEANYNTGALEATIFRPALQQSIRETARWKAAAMASALADLPPLPGYTNDALTQTKKDSSWDGVVQLNSALSNYRMKMASVKLVDLTNKHKSARQQLRESKATCGEAVKDLEFVTNRCRQQLYGQ